MPQERHWFSGVLKDPTHFATMRAKHAIMTGCMASQIANVSNVISCEANGKADPWSHTRVGAAASARVGHPGTVTR